MEIVFLGAKNPETLRMIRAIGRTDPDFRVRGFLDNDPARHGTFEGYPVFGGIDALTDEMIASCRFVNLITGSTRARYETSREMARRGCRFANFVHPSVDLDLTEIGTGNYLQEQVIVQAGAKIGNNSSVHIAALVAHEVTIGHSVFVAHAVSLSGEVVVEDGVFIGTNATVVPRVRIGRWSTIGAGSVVLKDVPPYSVAVGNPAKILRTVEPIHDSGDPLR
ncbi:MAG TPA: acetyltransferase [Candidatus Polarisedimenticolaceae bacterium]